MDFNSKRIFSSIEGSIKHQRALGFVDGPRRGRFLAVDRFFYESHEQVMGRGAPVWSMDYIICESQYGTRYLQVGIGILRSCMS